MTVIGRATLELLGDSSQFKREMTSAQRHFDGVGKTLERTTQRIAESMNRVGSTLTRVVSLPLLGVGAGAVAAATKMDTLERSLAAVAGSTGEAQRQLERLKEVAKLPGLGLAEAVQGSVRLQAVGVSAERAERALKAFGNAIATTGGGKGELERVTVQIGQLSAKGKILAQDLRPIIEAAPAVGKALRDAFGTVSPEEIEALGLSTDQFLDKLIAQLETLPKVTGGPKNAFENLQDALLRAGAAIGNVVLPSISALTERLATLLERVAEAHPRTLGLGVALGGIAIALGPTLIAISKLPGLLASATAGFKALQVAVFGLHAAIGPAGWVVLGISAIVGAVLAWDVAQKALNRSLAETPLAQRTIAGVQRELAAAEDQMRRFASAAEAAGETRLGERWSRMALEARNRVIELRGELERLKREASTIPGLEVVAERGEPKTGERASVTVPGIPSRTPDFLGAAAANTGALEALKMKAAEVRAAFNGIGTEGATALNTLQAGLVDVADLGISAFADFATGAKGAFRSFVNDALHQLARLAARLLVFKTLGALFPGSSIVGSLLGRASGGPVSGGHPYIVGERGPELFVPRNSGTIVPNHALAGGGDSGALAAAILARLGPRPGPGDPRVIANDNWWRDLFSELVRDGMARGVRFDK